jgi:hypothetical protein
MPRVSADKVSGPIALAEDQRQLASPGAESMSNTLGNA